MARPAVMVAIAGALLAASSFSAPVRAQEMPGCSLTTASDPERQVFDCGNGLIIEAEAAEAVSGSDPSQSVTVTDQAILIDVEPRSSFQILTPHAIATVRGTTFLVDVDEGSTSVFVVEGSVDVSRLDGSDTVVLNPGEGVDVAPGEPMTVRQWPQQRVDALLARFAR
ncbi:FecR domain-containing protein [Jiella marina]|uniref:FecR domain-containing protein n=1 Tax=Jiella sp. LLJ827 TaxID=2917712 RepID=UPI0021007E44|nr:FecR domain-containing protein [Jiella sp. LLJ827]MCQ0986607.1 FecR family protein [Jiella sp. LLJ827]